MARKIKKLDIGPLHPFLEEDIDILVNAINNEQELIDCELSELLGDINQCESCHIINSYTAKILRDYYVNWGWVSGGNEENKRWNRGAECYTKKH